MMIKVKMLKNKKRLFKQREQKNMEEEFKKEKSKLTIKKKRRRTNIPQTLKNLLRDF